MKTLDQKTVVITGAGSGIGQALALRAGSQGARLAISDVDEAGLAATVDLLKERGAHDLRSDRLDVSDRDAFASYAEEVAAHFGVVNAVINNAGVAHAGPVTEMEYSDFEWLMGINFWGVVHGTKEFLPHLIASGDGHLVNISSLFGLVPMPGQSTYNAAKFAVRGFTESVRMDMLMARHPVQVTCVHPGGIKTSIARSARVTSGEDQKATAKFFDEKLAKMTPEKCAKIILDGMLAGDARVLVGADAHAIHQLGKVLGSRYQDVVSAVARRVMP
ncbi:MAG: SDR family NAD(P)-dependent oxidoreductase [Myxococcales bacterium]|nr:MAG: SDR family NAD(P)-dependent oxidoreductase [Myxococcales bacterium]